MMAKGDGISSSVAISGKKAICASCSHDLGPADGNWKQSAIMRDVEIAQAGGKAYDTGHSGVLLRQFSCPGCGRLLDTETATADTPPLNDRIKAV